MMENDGRFDSKDSELVSKRGRTEPADNAVAFHSGYAPGFDPIKIKEFLEQEDIDHFLRVSREGMRNESAE